MFDGTYFISYKSEKVVYLADAVSTIHDVPDLKSQSQQNSKAHPTHIIHSPKFKCKASIGIARYPIYKSRTR